MNYLVKRISYGSYLAAYAEGGGLYNHFKETGRELPSPLTADEWIAEQGSLEGPVKEYIAYTTDESEVSDGVLFISDEESFLKSKTGYSVMPPEALTKQLALQESLASDVSEPEPELESADDVLVVDNFQDGNGNSPFDLQLRNTAKEAGSYVAILRDVPYSEVPDLKADYGVEYELEVTKGDTGYNFTFSVDLELYGKIRLRGGVPTPAGEGVKPELYLG